MNKQINILQIASLEPYHTTDSTKAIMSNGMSYFLKGSPEYYGELFNKRTNPFYEITDDNKL